MVIFHHHVKLPEGNLPEPWIASRLENLRVPIKQLYPRDAWLKHVFYQTNLNFCALNMDKPLQQYVVKNGDQGFLQNASKDSAGKPTEFIFHG